MEPTPRTPQAWRARTAPRKPPLHRRPLVVAAGSATLGFCCGAAFWHAIGFWSFVSDVVLKGPIDAPAVVVGEARTTQPPPVAQRPTGSISPLRPTAGGLPAAATRAYLTCSVVIPDAANGDAHVLPCAPGTGAASTKLLGRKADRLAVAAVEQHATAPPVPELPPTGHRQLLPESAPAKPPMQAIAPLSWTPTIRGTTR